MHAPARRGVRARDRDLPVADDNAERVAGGRVVRVGAAPAPTHGRAEAHWLGGSHRSSRGGRTADVHPHGVAGRGTRDCGIGQAARRLPCAQVILQTLQCLRASAQRGRMGDEAAEGGMGDGVWGRFRVQRRGGVREGKFLAHFQF